MEERLKGLESTIQAYIDNHDNSDVTLEISRDIDFQVTPHRQKSMSWKITVTHSPIELL